MTSAGLPYSLAPAEGKKKNKQKESNGMAVRMLLGNSVIQPYRTSNKNNSWVNIDCLTGCLICLSSHRPSLPVRSRTMSSNTNSYFFFLNTEHRSFSVPAHLLPFVSLTVILRHVPAVVFWVFFPQMSPIFHCFFSPSQTPVTDLLAGSHYEVCTLWWRFPTAWQFKKLEKQTLLLLFILAFFEDCMTS